MPKQSVTTDIAPWLVDDMIIAIRRGYRLQYEQAQESWVILFPEGMITLNETAGMILDYCQRYNTVGNLIAALAEKFPDDDVTDDVRDFLREAHEQYWIEFSQP